LPAGRPQLCAFWAVTLEPLIFTGRAPHRPSMAGAACPYPCGQTRHISGFCGGPRGAEKPHRDAAFQIKRFLLNIMFQTRFPLKYGREGYCHRRSCGARQPDDSAAFRAKPCPGTIQIAGVLKRRSGANCFACRTIIAVGWMKPDAPKTRRKERIVRRYLSLQGARGLPRKGVSD